MASKSSGVRKRRIGFLSHTCRQQKPVPGKGGCTNRSSDEPDDDEEDDYYGVTWHNNEFCEEEPREVYEEADWEYDEEHDEHEADIDGLKEEENEMGAVVVNMTADKEQKLFEKLCEHYDYQDDDDTKRVQQTVVSGGTVIAITALGLTGHVVAALAICLFAVFVLSLQLKGN